MSELQHDVIEIGDELPCTPSKILHAETFAKTGLRVFYYEHDDE